MSDDARLREFERVYREIPSREMRERLIAELLRLGQREKAARVAGIVKLSHLPPTKSHWRLRAREQIREILLETLGKPEKEIRAALSVSDSPSWPAKMWRLEVALARGKKRPRNSPAEKRRMGAEQARDLFGEANSRAHQE